MSKSLVVQAEEAHRLYTTLGRLATTDKLNELALAEVLYTLKKNNNFKKAVGEGVDSWTQFLALPEINISWKRANFLMQVYDILVVKHGYSEERISRVPTRALVLIIPLARKIDDKDVIDSLLDNAEHLSQQDFKLFLFELKNPDTIKTYEYQIIQKCIETGTIRKVKGVRHEEIKEAFGLPDSI